MLIEVIAGLFAAGLAAAVACGLVLSGRIEARDDDLADRLLTGSTQVTARLERLARHMATESAAGEESQLPAAGAAQHPPSKTSAYA